MISGLDKEWAQSTYLCEFSNGVTKLAINKNTFLNGSTQFVPPYTNLGDVFVFDIFIAVNDILLAKLAKQQLVRIGHEVAQFQRRHMTKILKECNFSTELLSPIDIHDV